MRSLYLLAVFIVLCSVSTSCVTVDTGDHSSSPSLESLGITSSGDLALAKLTCRNYTPAVLPAQTLEYQLRNGQYIDFNLLNTTWEQAAVDVSILTAPVGSKLYNDIGAVTSTLSQMSTKAVQDYRIRTITPSMNAFDTSDLSVSADCLVLTQE